MIKRKYIATDKIIKDVRKNLKRASALVLAAALGIGSAAFPYSDISGSLSVTGYAAGRSAMVNTDSLNVRSGPATTYDKVATLTAGTVVTINSETKGSDGYVWYNISWNGGSGYARYDYIFVNETFAVADASFEQWMNTQGFPESYKNGLRGLHQKYPNWVFMAENTGLDWNTVITEESKIGRNLVSTSAISSWKSIATGAFDWAGNYWPGFDGDSWVQASTELISYYMDPRNFLTEPYVYQFELQKYDSSRQTKDGLMKLISGTFLDAEVTVPVEGSQIEGGTIIEGSVAGTTGTSSSSASSSSGSSSASSSGTSAIGPGSSGSSSSSNVIGPGMTTGPGASGSGSTSSSGSAVITAGPGSTVADAGRTSNSFIDALSSITGNITAYANWQKDASDKWVYYDSTTGNMLNNGWNWLDGNNDGIAECYYFYPDGSLAVSTTVDGYTVDADGKWTDANGVIQTRSVETSKSGGELKKVSYADIIMKAAEVSGVSPYVLASAILQEQGKGTSDLISGRSSNYPGIYNYYNTGAYAHDGMSAVTAGLAYAAETGNGDRPWNTIEKAIIGGAKMYGANYVNNGQDTFYLKKFNVQGSNKYNHQFMTHVLAAASEGSKIAAAYSDSMKQTSLVFKIPVYSNMPDSTALPTVDGNPNNKLSALSVDGYTITPTFTMDTVSYSLIVDGSVSGVNITAKAIDSKAVVSGAGSVALNVGNNDINITVRAENGSERVYKLTITRRDNVSADSGSSSTVSVGTDTGGNSSGGVISAGPGAAAVTDSSGSTTGSSSVIMGPGTTAAATAAAETVSETTAAQSSGTVVIGAMPQ